MSDLIASSLPPVSPPAVGTPTVAPAPYQTDTPSAVDRSPTRDDILSLRSLIGQPKLDARAFERQILDTERDVLEAARRGLARADAILQNAQAALAEPHTTDDARRQKLLTLGAQVAQVAETTQAHSTFPLIQAGQLHYPHVELPTFTLFGTDDSALITPDPFLPGPEPADAHRQLHDARARLQAADAQLLEHRTELDNIGLALAGTEFDAHPSDGRIPPPVPAGFTLREHGQFDPFNVVALVAPSAG